jgi:hypothetical protein
MRGAQLIPGTDRGDSPALDRDGVAEHLGCGAHGSRAKQGDVGRHAGVPPLGSDVLVTVASATMLKRFDIFSRGALVTQASP